MNNARQGRGTPHPHGEDWLTQVLHSDGQWLDYARATEEQTRSFLARMQRQEPGRWRAVDWINKGTVLIQPNCWCGKASLYVEPVDVAVTNPTTWTSDGMPGIAVCLDHVGRDGFEKIEARS